ncbi:type VI secretion system baseplate subunit TssE [Phreatobacter sp. AB_2022a]|uniref:type VI secretion system baseplate subunit TssE n=1 Tax=Phreatobacter sp. AB_2022a TaxID=3003134 RepID=UPI000579B55C|nr:type VI secretion system baseplate subunit TssE [Phreatobacter sp. AB_2022a]MCZ0737648.1 type VI secretion system baseplate subunit TssE [Phreatobacter sp. AB_2022a]CEJ14871.1 Gene 25-like lysozyme [bacterium YEK0313]
MGPQRSKDRLSPPLMHAFRSAHAERSFAPRIGDAAAGDAPRQARPTRLSGRPPITEGALRQEVARDLANLVNTVSLASAIDLDGFDAVRRSVLNFGLREVTAHFADQAADGRLARDVEEAIRHHEPRLLAGTLRIKQVVRVDEPSLNVRLEISADLSCEPVDVPVVFIADIDVDSRKINIARASAS